jgi:hypothetical protein
VVNCVFGQSAELRALDPMNGSKLWSSPIQTAPANQQITLPPPSPVIGDGESLLVSDAGKVMAFR